MYFDDKLYGRVWFAVGLFAALPVVDLADLYVIMGAKVFYHLAFIYYKVITVNKFSV